MGRLLRYIGVLVFVLALSAYGLSQLDNSDSDDLISQIKNLKSSFSKPKLDKFKEVPSKVICAIHLKELGAAMAAYSNGVANNGFPTAEKWCDLLAEGYVDGSSLKCKFAEKGLSNYAVNKYAIFLGAKIPSKMVLAFDSKSGWNLAGGTELLSTENHQGDGCNVLFGDGHVEYIAAENIPDLKWK